MLSLWLLGRLPVGLHLNVSCFVGLCWVAPTTSPQVVECRATRRLHTPVCPPSMRPWQPSCCLSNALQRDTEIFCSWPWQPTILMCRVFRYRTSCQQKAPAWSARATQKWPHSRRVHIVHAVHDAVTHVAVGNVWKFIRFYLMDMSGPRVCAHRGNTGLVEVVARCIGVSLPCTWTPLSGHCVTTCPCAPSGNVVSRASTGWWHWGVLVSAA